MLGYFITTSIYKIDIKSNEEKIEDKEDKPYNNDAQYNNKDNFTEKVF